MWETLFALVIIPFIINVGAGLFVNWLVSKFDDKNSDD